LTYLISRKLKQEGYKGNQFYSKVVNDGRLEEFKNRLIELIKTDIIIEIKTK
jgi:hypothetical protein